MVTDDTRRDSEVTTHEGTAELEFPRALTGGAGRYRVVGELGRGGMGEVLEAHDDQLGRDVAIKRLRAVAPSPRSVERFLREAKIQGRLDHPAIPPVHELGHDETGRPFFAMKKLAGTTLAKLIADGAERPRLLRAFVDVCLAIEFAHTRGIIHRDLKPTNVMLGDFGEVYVLDWGVAKIVGERDDGEDAPSTFDRAQHPTEAGTAIGTAGYMAPEQVRGLEDIDGRVDVYSLGCILFEILSGKSLHPGGEAGLVSALAGVDARPSRLADIPPELDVLCVRATADRLDRFATARELGEHVQRYLDGDRDLATRRELAHEHYQRAVVAFTAQTEDTRRAAMREAGRALALDPKLAGAAELVTRLMLEPPREVPAEVVSSIAAEDLQTIRANARTAMYVYFGYLAFVPAIAAGAGLGMVAALGALIVLNMTLLGLHGHTRVTPRPLRLVLANAALVFFIAMMFSPLLVAPGVAAVTGMLLVFSPTYRRFTQAAGVIVVMSAAVVGPWIAERAGWIARTTVNGEAGIAIVAPGLHVHAFFQNFMLVGVALALIVIASLMGWAVRQSERRVRQALHLQAWQLRQLVG